MKRLAPLTLLAAALVLPAACAEEEVKTEPDAAEPVTVTVIQTVTAGDTGTEAEEGGTTTEASDPPEPGAAGVGDSITLAGYESGYKVTLVKVRNNPPHDEFIPPERGMRYYAVYLKVKVTDGSTTEVCASSDSSVVDGQSQTFAASVYDAAEPGFGCPRIAVGKERAGWVTFEVPKRARLVSFTYTPDAGFADETGEWQIGR
jgi:hypothetical protein